MLSITLGELPQEVHSRVGAIQRLSYPQQGCTSDSAIEGYGRQPLSDDEYHYFNGLYEFF